ncbi:MAG: hemolysin III family protein [Flavobacteriaceae bacterium]|nr:hemolysin III family protein [Flavobacteriaceae bacterium]
MEENNSNYYDPKEEKLNVITHGFGLFMSFVALFFLTKKTLNYNTIHLVSFVIFGCSLILLYAASTFYHASKDPKKRYKLNIFDHASIYVLIAGTYTPFTLLVLDGWVGWAIFGVSWGLALIGIILKLFFTGKYDRASTFAYVFMGWLIVFAIKPLIENLSFEGLMWLFAGGIFYTVGAILYSIEKIKYNHAIFHIFVLLGSFAHFMAVYYHILPKQ